MLLHDFTPRLKKYVTARLKDEGDPVTIAAEATEEDGQQHIVIITSYAGFRVPRPVYQMAFQPLLHIEPPPPGEGLYVRGKRGVDAGQYLQQWNQIKNVCQTPVRLTPYLLELPIGKNGKQIRLLWADPFALWVDTDILGVVDARQGDLRTSGTGMGQIYFRGNNTEAIFLPWMRWMESERPGNALLAQEAALAKAWHKQRAR